VKTTRRRTAAVTGVLALALVGAACGSSGGSSSDTTAGAATTAAGSTAAPTTGGAAVSGTLQGSGSTFQAAFQEEAISDFQKANSGTTITYGGGGSGKGRTDLANKVVDFETALYRYLR